MTARALVGATLLCAAACDAKGVDLERMIDQAKAEPYEESRFFPDGRAMQVPPAGTVPRGRTIGQAALTEGVVNDEFVTAIPVEVTPELVRRGQNRFNIFCAPCHGVAGDSQSEVARNMTLRKPPSLVDLVAGERVEQPPPAPPPPGEPVKQRPRGPRNGPGGIFHAITNGYGLMPSYAADLPAHDRWAVVAYVQALSLSQRAPLDELPPELRDEAVRALEAQPGEQQP